MLLKKILWALVPVIASKLFRKRRDRAEAARADKTRWTKKHGR